MERQRGPAEAPNHGTPATPRPAASASAGAIPPASPGASAVVSPADDPFAPVRFAVDLFDVDESTIAPGSAAAIEALGTDAGAGASPAPGQAGGEAVERPTTRDELWVPIVLLVLLALTVEWALYHRDGLVRVRRSLEARFGRGGRDARPGRAG